MMEKERNNRNKGNKQTNLCCNNWINQVVLNAADDGGDAAVGLILRDYELVLVKGPHEFVENDLLHDKASNWGNAQVVVAVVVGYY